MHIANRSGKMLGVQTFNWSDGVRWIPAKHYKLKKDGEIDKGQGYDKVSVDVWTDGPEKIIDRSGPYLNTGYIVLVNGGHDILDWNAVKQKYATEFASVTADIEKPNAALERGLAAAADVLGAMATGLAAMGPAGAAPAALVQLVSSMIGMAAQGEEPTPPPDRDEIEGMLERALKEQSEKDFALEATDSFLMAHQWLIDQDAEIREASKNKPQGASKKDQDLLRDFYEHLESWADENRQFRTQVHRVCRQPEIAKWIIPAFLEGISAHLQIMRLHAVAHHKTSQATILQLQREVESCKKALLAAATAWWNHILNLLKKEKLPYPCTEADWIYHTLNRVYVGADVVGPMPSSGGDATPVGSAVNQLDLISGYLQADLDAIAAGKAPTHLFKPGWEEPWKQLA